MTDTAAAEVVELELAAAALGLERAVLVAWARRGLLAVELSDGVANVHVDALVAVAAARLDHGDASEAAAGLHEAITETVRRNDPAPARAFLDVMARAAAGPELTSPTFTGALSDAGAAELVARYPGITG